MADPNVGAVDEPVPNTPEDALPNAEGEAAAAPNASNAGAGVSANAPPTDAEA
jgi:hypothetical protein